MILKVTEDGYFLQVEDATMLELEQLKSSFTKKKNNHFIIKKKNPNAIVDESFVDRFHRIPLGLYMEVINMCKKYNFQCYIREWDKHIKNVNYDESHYDSWEKDFFSKSEFLKPRYYQTAAVKAAIKYKFGYEEISTSGGKTFIGYTLFKYLYDSKQIKKLLFIVPNIGLINQTEEKFYKYTTDCNQPVNFKTACAFGGSGDIDPSSVDVVFGTYQTLVKKDINFYTDFDAVIVDETHHSSNMSIRSILAKCLNTKVKIGLTGTMHPDGSYNSFLIQAYIGPKIYELPSSVLIDEGNATPVHIIGIELDYLDQTIKKKLFDLRNVPTDDKDGAKLLNIEKQLVRENQKRFNYITNFINKVSKNTLVLFNDIQNNYGKKIYDWLKENKEDFTIFYVDGGTNSTNRDYYKEQMENNNNVIIIASSGTFSEGIDISNIFNIITVESNKSEFIVAQVIGRGMRLKSNKDYVTLIDFIDDFSHGSGYQKLNYLMRHAAEREKIYKERKFPYARTRVRL